MRRHSERGTHGEGAVIRKLWRGLPETPAKARLRVLRRNWLERGRAHFAYDGQLYLTRLGISQVISRVQPFGLPFEVESYCGQYRPAIGDVILDAGAYDGLLASYLALQVGSAGRVISIEPDPDNERVVRETIALNSVEDVVATMRVGVWDAVGELSFFAGGSGSIGSSTYYAMPGSHATTIGTTTIDALVAELELSRVDFIKMNIEGAEVHALSGARDTLARFRPKVAVAAHHWIDGELTKGPVEDFLRAHDYVAETRSIGGYPLTYAAPRT